VSVGEREFSVVAIGNVPGVKGKDFICKLMFVFKVDKC